MPPKPLPRSRKEAKDATREALLSAGIELFAEQGLDAPSLDEICERAGKTRGAFYVHFDDRDAFLVAVMDRVGSLFLDAVLPAASALGEGDGPDLATTVERFVDAVEAGAYPLMGQAGLRFHQLLDACARSPLVRDRYASLVSDSLARIASQVESGQKKGTLRQDLAPHQAATMILSAVIGAQTMRELEVPFDLRASALALLLLLSPPASTGKH